MTSPYPSRINFLITFQTKQRNFPLSRFAETENLFSFLSFGGSAKSAKKSKGELSEHHLHVIYASESIEQIYDTLFLSKWLRKY